jgi:hypothetical protein
MCHMQHGKHKMIDCLKNLDTSQWRVFAFICGTCENTNSRAQVLFCQLPSHYVAQLNVRMVKSSLADCNPVVYTYISISQITKHKTQNTKHKNEAH